MNKNQGRWTKVRIYLKQPDLTQTNNYADWLKSYTERDDLRNILRENTFLVVVLSGSTGC